MANNYTQFSNFLVVRDRKERLWLERELESPFKHWEYLKLQEKYPNEEEWAKHRDAWLAKWAEERHIEPSEAHDYAESWPGFDFEWDDNGILFYSEEDADIDVLKEIVRRFLVKFKRQDAFVIEWADWCSKARTGAFGGGALIVTGEDDSQDESLGIYEMSTTMWVREKLDKLGKKVRR